MKRFSIILVLVAALLGVTSCIKEPFTFGENDYLPEGTPVTLYLGFGAEDPTDIQIGGTKADAGRIDESTIHDLYVLIFKSDGSRLYGRYFTYEHRIADISTLNNQKNEGWYVNNVTLDDINSSDPNRQSKQTRGIVKIATEAASGCTLVVLANLASTVFSMDEKDAASRLAEIATLDELKTVRVKLEQNIVTRGNRFLMMGILSGVNTGVSGTTPNPLRWGYLTGSTPTYYNENNAVVSSPDNFQVQLIPLDAKIKFRIRYDKSNIKSVTPRYWQACRVPESCFLYPDDSVTRDEHDVFDAQEAYFEGTEVVRDEADPDNPAKYTIYNVFCFYMLENRQTALKSVLEYNLHEYESKYYLRELQNKTPDPDPEHAGYVVNGSWLYARPEATFVKFNLVLELTQPGMGNLDIYNPDMTDKAAALTSEALFTVHLGDFDKSTSSDESRFDDYNVRRGYNYTYDITVKNSKSIYVEVCGQKQQGGGQSDPVEKEPGHQGSLLLTTEGIINCDAHYEYHSLDFKYDSDLGKDSANNNGEEWPIRQMISWYVKSPFHKGEATFNPSTGFYEFQDSADSHPDYQWILFSLNKKVNGRFTKSRREYPGYDKADMSGNYIPSWQPDPNHPEDVPALMDINQLINFIFLQNQEHYQHSGSSGDLFAQETGQEGDDGLYHIRVTAYINEYYYERDPRTYTKVKIGSTNTYATDPMTGDINPNLWREFVNAKPRELHILSNTQISKDRQSDVIISSHSIIQESIQTIYNIYAPDLTSLWGVEHKDEMSAKARSKIDFELSGWPWAGGTAPVGQVQYGDDENGRLNSAGLWGLTSSSAQRWNDFMNLEVDNDTPELKNNRYYQMYSCMTRNRDNNGNGFIDPDEVRWYTASVNQLVGMWVGNESLSLTARLYQPVDPFNKGSSADDQSRWRAVVISSTYAKNGNNYEPRILRAEEAATKSFYSTTFDSFTTTIRDKCASVRCLRNIGTYYDRGTLTDITDAPYEQMFDQYFDYKAGQDPNGKAYPNDDGTYTINFTRLNMKSIRGFTENELPYHEEYSTNNMVYLRFTAQAPSEAIVADGTNLGKQKTFNDAVSIHNTYCPPGYRVPNMTELLMMTAVLPESYWHKDNDASIALPSSPVAPCRTYFSRGLYGSLKTGTEQTKVGWGYNPELKRLLLPTESQALKLIRCVKDENMIGDITGRLSVANNENLRVRDMMEIELNFSSMTSAIRTVELSLCYTDSSGDPREIEISNEGLNLGSTTLRQTIKRIVSEDLPVDGFMSVKAVVRNAAGIVRIFETPIRIIPQIYASLRLLPCEYTGSVRKSLPILITASHFENDITSWTLRVTTPDHRVSMVPVDITGSSNYMSIIFPYYPGWNGSDPYWENDDWEADSQYKTLDKTLITGTYTFQLEARRSGEITRSEEVSMDVLKADYDPLGGMDMSTVHTEADLIDNNDVWKNKWRREMIEGLDFVAGDFIETDMDISRCIFIPSYKVNTYTINLDQYTYFRKVSEGVYEKLTPEYYAANPSETYYIIDDASSVGLDCLISFGVSDIGWTNWSLHVFYPAEPLLNTANGAFLRFNAVWNAPDDYEGNNQTKEITPVMPLHLRLDKDGLYWNNNLMDVTKFSSANQGNVQNVLNHLTASKTIYVGSVGGGTPTHISRAIYRFVRVVHNGEYSSTTNSNTDFENDPVFGGNL